MYPKSDLEAGAVSLCQGVGGQKVSFPNAVPAEADLALLASTRQCTKNGSPEKKEGFYQYRDVYKRQLYFLITTAGNDTNSICYEVHQKAIDIAEGRKVDPTFYSVIYGAAEDEDWTDPKVWKKANPSLGITVGIDKVKAACESAQQNPGEENAFRQLRLNQWVKQSVRWMPMDKWDACAFPVSEDDLEGRICYGGLDLSSTTDITAFVLVFPPLDEEDKYYILPYFWIPEETLDLRVRRDHVPYDLWERQGTLMTTEGNVVHYGYIEKFIEQLGELSLIHISCRYKRHRQRCG